MKVYNLCCESNHLFEGWFGSEADYHSQFERGLINCPLCGSARIEKRPSAPRLNLSGAQAPKVAEDSTAPDHSSPSSVPSLSSPLPLSASGTLPKSQGALQQQASLLALAREVLAKTEDVGTNFANEARKIHYQDAPERPIRGLATHQERQALAEEGIDVLALAIPAALKETLQ